MKNSLLNRFQKRKKLKKEQAAGLEQTKQKEAESPIEPIIQPELERLHSIFYYLLHIQGFHFIQFFFSSFLKRFSPDVRDNHQVWTRRHCSFAIECARPHSLILLTFYEIEKHPPK